MSPLLSFFAGVAVGGIVIGSIVSRALHRQLRGILAAPGYERAMARACVAARRRPLAPQQGQAPVGGLAGDAERGFAGEAGRGFAGEAGRGLAGDAPFFTSPLEGEVGAQAPGGGLAGDLEGWRTEIAFMLPTSAEKESIAHSRAGGLA